MSILDKLFYSTCRSTRLLCEGLYKMACERVMIYRDAIESFAKEIGVYDDDSSIEAQELYITIRDAVIRHYGVRLEDYYHGMNLPFELCRGDSSVYERGRKLFKQTDFYKNGNYNNNINEAISDFLNSKLD